MEVLVGRAGNQAMTINDSSVAKIHCKLMVMDSGLITVENMSRQGTYLNGDPVMRKTLVKPDDELRLGDSFIVKVRDLLVQEDYAAYTNYLYVAKKYTNEAEVEAFITAAAKKSAQEMPPYVMPVVKLTLAYYYIQCGELYKAQMLIYKEGDAIYDMQDGSELLQGIYASVLELCGSLYLEAGRYAEAKEAADGAMSIFKRLPTDTLSTTKEQIEAVNELHEQLSVI